MAKNKKNMGNSKVSYDYEQIKDILLTLGMNDLTNIMVANKKYMLVEKLITFADVPGYGKYEYDTKHKDDPNAFTKEKIEERVKKNKLYYNLIKDMKKYENENSTEKLFFVQTKQGNITLPKKFYAFINTPAPRESKSYSFKEEDGYEFYIVRSSIEDYFTNTKTNECLDVLEKDHIEANWTLPRNDIKFIKTTMSVGVHGIGGRLDFPFHKIRGNVFARDKILVLAEKDENVIPFKYKIYIMFFRNPKFFSLLGIGAKAYCRALFNENIDTKEESRKGQAKWRDMLAELGMALEDNDTIICPITNSIVHYETEGTLLRASHIKEYCKCKDETGKIKPDEAYDPNNGLLITADADALFDKHLITINPNNGKIVFSKNISTVLKDKLNFKDKIDVAYLTEERKVYLQFHFDRFNELEGKRI